MNLLPMKEDEAVRLLSLQCPTKMVLLFFLLPPALYFVNQKKEKTREQES